MSARLPVVRDVLLRRTSFGQHNFLLNLCQMKLVISKQQYPCTGIKYYNKPSMSLQEFLYFLFKYSVVLKITMIYFISCKEQSTTFFYIAVTLYLCVTLYLHKSKSAFTHTHTHTIYCCRKSQVHYTTKQRLPNNLMDTLPSLY